MEKVRCFGGGEGKEFYAAYHDEEWGLPTYDDATLFEFLILEGAQAGLAWITVLKKREGYRAVFDQFDPNKIDCVALTSSKCFENFENGPLF